MNLAQSRSAVPEIFDSQTKQELIRRRDNECKLLRSAPGSYPNSAEITQNNAITLFKVIQGHRFWYQYDFLLVISTNVPPLLHRFRDIAVDRSEIVILGYPCCV